MMKIFLKHVDIVHLAPKKITLKSTYPGLGGPIPIGPGGPEGLGGCCQPGCCGGGCIIVL